MTGFEAPSALDRLSLSSLQQRVLRAVVLVASLVFVGLVPLAGGDLTLLYTAPALVLAVLAALLPESNVPLGLLLWLAVLWLRSVPDDVDAWTLVAAVALAVLHVACTLVAHGPPGLVLDRPLLLRWARRLLLGCAAAATTWAAATTVALLDLPPSRLVLAAALLVLLGWAALLAVRLAHSDAE